eukprot:CCRYP_003569-RD/>CCRYP_003569-RD protein AED:0.48 eAED:0.48 QI:0/-1/0/1/-1/0/1/0/33
MEGLWDQVLVVIWLRRRRRKEGAWPELFYKVLC